MSNERDSTSMAKNKLSKSFLGVGQKDDPKVSYSRKGGSYKRHWSQKKTGKKG